MKYKLKRLFLSVTIVIMVCSTGSHSAKAQGMPVYDNTNFLSLAKSLIESAKQTSQLLKTVEFLKDQKQNIDRVNNVVKQLKAVREMTRNNQILFNIVRNDLRDILNSPYIKPDEISKHVQELSSIFSPGGGFVFQQVHNILANVSPENVVAMFESIHKT